MINKTGQNEMYLLVGLFLASFQLVQSKVRDLGLSPQHDDFRSAVAIRTQPYRHRQLSQPEMEMNF